MASDDEEECDETDADRRSGLAPFRRQEFSRVSTLSQHGPLMRALRDVGGRRSSSVSCEYLARHPIERPGELRRGRPIPAHRSRADVDRVRPASRREACTASACPHVGVERVAVVALTMAAPSSTLRSSVRATASSDRRKRPEVSLRPSSNAGRGSINFARSNRHFGSRTLTMMSRR